MGRRSISPWPARSPILTVFDFYLWGRINDMIFAQPPTTRENMIGCIIHAINSISTNAIEAAATANIERANRCVEQNGSHFEHIL